ncbi:MAG TPA: HDOD domain-containing protein [Gammaproteobacteria bacterium]|nr:HDOD domain-containing protein [Gammaproteobacteria bacterium]
MLIEPPEKAPEISVTRQPVYNESAETFGYELLFRHSDAEFSSLDHSDPESSQIIANVFMEIGLKLLVGDKPAFINLPHGFIREQQSIPFAKDKFILQVAASGAMDDALIAAIGELHAQGFSIALDELVMDANKQALLGYSDMIKLDISGYSDNELADYCVQLQEANRLLLAKRVDSQDDFERCKSLGFRYFQGSFLSEPKVVRYKTLPTNKLLLLEILARIQDPEVELVELEELINRDVGISFKFLRLINSANFGLSKKVESLHQAMLLLGLKEIKSWVSLAALSNIDAVPQELTDMSIMRARMCKALAQKAGCEDPDAFFTVGMFSLIDAIMSKSMTSILKSLPFSDEINEALLRRKSGTAMAEALDCVIAHEQGEWHMIKFARLTAQEIRQVYIDSLEWCRGVRSQLA